ncbi:MAG: arsenate reductase family protein [Thomasclavelia sp.]|nr:arsenate reductase family protein [Thomasclavelia sp.]
MINFICYPKCSTCLKAKKHLDSLNIKYKQRHIVEERLTKEELKELYHLSGLPLKRFFNTSGMKYKELQLKDKLPTMSEDQQLELLSTDGMLVKRPILVTKDKVILGYKKDEYDKLK